MIKQGKHFYEFTACFVNGSWVPGVARIEADRMPRGWRGTFTDDPRGVMFCLGLDRLYPTKKAALEATAAYVFRVYGHTFRALTSVRPLKRMPAGQGPIPASCFEA